MTKDGELKDAVREIIGAVNRMRPQPTVIAMPDPKDEDDELLEDDEDDEDDELLEDDEDDEVDGDDLEDDDKVKP